MTTIIIEREVLDEIVELFDSAITARFPHEILRDLRAALAAPATALVVTKNESGQIVAVTLQDEDGRIVEVLAESAPAPASEPVAWMTDEIQPRVASDYTKSNMPSAAAVSFSIPLYRVSPATAPEPMQLRQGECWPEGVMKQWDYYRDLIANGDTSSVPRDWFESLAEMRLIPTPATAPSWNDAPTCAGVWLSDRGYENPYRWGTYNVVDPAHEKGMTLEDERWFGPIPEDKP